MQAHLPYPTPRHFVNRLCDSLSQAEVSDCLNGLVVQLDMRRSQKFRQEVVQFTRESFGTLFIEWPMETSEVRGYQVLSGRTVFRDVAALIVSTCIPSELEGAASLALKWVSGFGPPETTPLAPNEVRQALEENRLPLSTRVVGFRKPLLVFCIKGTDPQLNASYQSALNAIFASAPRLNCEGADRRYVLLHEVGHALHTAITRDLSRVPESFLPVFYVTTGGKDGNAIPKEDLAEVFADTFSVAASFETVLAEHNPFCVKWPRSLQLALFSYFSLLVDNAFRNLQTVPLGECDIVWTPSSWRKYYDSWRDELGN